jgi:hypothetical protein
MLKQLVGAVVLVLALAGPLALETQSTSPAQATALNAVLSPLYARPGAAVTVSSVDPCPRPMTVFWSEGPGSPGGAVNTDGAGAWTFTLKAPTRVGVIPIFVHCAMSPSNPADASYKQLNFTVVAPTPPTYPG